MCKRGHFKDKKNTLFPLKICWMCVDSIKKTVNSFPTLSPQFVRFFLELLCRVCMSSKKDETVLVLFFSLFYGSVAEWLTAFSLGSNGPEFNPPCGLWR